MDSGLARLNRQFTQGPIVMDNPYLQVIDGLTKHKIRAYFQNADQLVISWQTGLAWPEAGNSCWISYKQNRWYICTWPPNCYLLPLSTDIVKLSAEFLARGNAAQSVVPLDLIEKYGLNLLDDAVASELFGLDADEELDPG